MSRTLLTEPCFFQPLLPGFEDNFLIPIAFSKYLNGQVCEKAMLRSRKGKKLWPVKINGRRFGDGWKKFVEDHGLKIGEFLVFRYKGDLIFNVMVFDRSTCEKEYAPPTALEEEKIQIQEQNLQEDSTCGKEVKTGLKAKASPSIVEYPSCVKEEEIEIEEQTLPNDSTRGKEVKTRLEEKASSSTLENPHCVIELSRDSFIKTELYGRSCSMILQDEEGKCWPSKLKFRSSNGKTLIRDAWKSFRDAHKLKLGDSIIVELAKNGQIPVLKLTIHT
ncbi:B3 domain-containing protein REM5-like [Euphorbia lathyris]|uniref:B3 domain-containing protein REM5-like n=1 Tax=Euphorbia lathyris TaxID=212925 RepID=UPI0033133136